MAHLGAWNITITGALNAIVTLKQYFVRDNSTALLAACTTDTESQMNKVGIFLETDHDIANIYSCASSDGFVAVQNTDIS